MRQRILVGVLGSGVLFLGVPAAPASGAPLRGAVSEDCEAGRICVWNGPTYQGQMSSTNKISACATGKSRSAVNNHPQLSIVFYDAADCTGKGFKKLAPGTRVDAFTTPGGQDFSSAVRVSCVADLGPACLDSILQSLFIG